MTSIILCIELDDVDLYRKKISVTDKLTDNDIFDFFDEFIKTSYCNTTLNESDVRRYSHTCINSYIEWTGPEQKRDKNNFTGPVRYTRKKQKFRFVTNTI